MSFNPLPPQPLSHPPVDVIPPPPDLKVIIDKAASYAARLGPQFESRIADTERGNPKFSFLIPSDPFHAYYVYKVNELKSKQEAGTLMSSGVSSAIPSALNPAFVAPTDIVSAIQAHKIPTKDESAKDTKPETKAAKKTTLASLMAELKLASNPVESPETKFLLDVPEISALELDIIRLTAQFVARNGKTFYSGLLTREQNNIQFGFLRPNHQLHPFFNALVESYNQILLPPRDLNVQLTDNQNKQKSLGKIFSYAEYQRIQLKNAKSQEEIEEEERSARSLIDWHNFVVVETIEFDDDDEAIDPKTIQDKADDEVDMSETTEDIQQPEIDNTNIKILKNYTRNTSKSVAQKFQICPICSQSIAVNELNEHMRIELMDPRYAKMKREYLERAKADASLASNEEMARNLEMLSRKRKKEEELLDEDSGSKTDKVIWDGHTSSTARTSASGMSINDQIAALNAKKEDKSTISASPVPAVSTVPAPVLPPSYLLQQQQAMAPGIIPHMGVHPMGRPGMPGMFPNMVLGGDMMAPVIPPGAALANDEPLAKKPKTEAEEKLSNLVPEEQFISVVMNGQANIEVQVQLPTSEPGSVAEKAGWSLTGQIVKIGVSLTDKVSQLKEKIKEMTGMPANKQNLKCADLAFLKDQNSLAFYNIRPETIIMLSVKERGGRGNK